MKHEPEHEEVLQALLVGDERADSDRARVVLRDCATCRESHARNSRLVTRIEALERERREVLADARTRDRAPGLDRVVSTLDRLRRGENVAPEERLRRPRRMLWVLVAASVLALAAVAVRSGWLSSSGPKDTPLDSGEIELVEPIGDGASFDQFSWRCASDASLESELVITYTDAISHELRIDRHSTRQTWWKPSEDEKARFGAEIRWKVLVIELSGQGPPTVSREVRARRR